MENKGLDWSLEPQGVREPAKQSGNTRDHWVEPGTGGQKPRARMKPGSEQKGPREKETKNKQAGARMLRTNWQDPGTGKLGIKGGNQETKNKDWRLDRKPSVLGSEKAVAGKHACEGN